MKRSVILTDRLGPDILLVLTMKRQVLHRERAHLKVPGCSLVLSALLTKKLPTYYVPVCTTNLQILTVICCIHHHIHRMSRTPFLILNFLDFDVYVVMTPIFPANQRRCASSSKNVAILSLWSKWAIIAPNNLIDSHHYKRHIKIRMTEFHSPSLSILIITQSKASFLIILNYSKMIPRLVESFRNLHLFHSNAAKT